MHTMSVQRLAVIRKSDQARSSILHVPKGVRHLFGSINLPEALETDPLDMPIQQRDIPQYIIVARPRFLMFDEQLTVRACTLTLLTAGKSIAARSAMMAITTSNSIKVKPAG